MHLAFALISLFACILFSTTYFFQLLAPSLYSDLTLNIIRGFQCELLKPRTRSLHHANHLSVRSLLCQLWLSVHFQLLPTFESEPTLLASIIFTFGSFYCVHCFVLILSLSHLFLSSCCILSTSIVASKSRSEKIPQVYIFVVFNLILHAFGTLVNLGLWHFQRAFIAENKIWSKLSIELLTIKELKFEILELTGCGFRLLSEKSSN